MTKSVQTREKPHSATFFSCNRPTIITVTTFFFSLKSFFYFGVVLFVAKRLFVKPFSERFRLAAPFNVSGKKNML